MHLAERKLIRNKYICAWCKRRLSLSTAAVKNPSHKGRHPCSPSQRSSCPALSCVCIFRWNGTFFCAGSDGGTCVSVGDPVLASQASGDPLAGSRTRIHGSFSSGKRFGQPDLWTTRGISLSESRLLTHFTINSSFEIAVTEQRRARLSCVLGEGIAVQQFPLWFSLGSLAAAWQWFF